MPHRIRWLGLPCMLPLLLPGETSKFGSVEAKPAKGDAGACIELVGTFLSTELSEGRFEAKPEKGETGTESIELLIELMN